MMTECVTAVSAAATMSVNNERDDKNALKVPLQQGFENPLL
jgi:hypothetical protein